uniref:Uncharacterized protein n=1 Tax=Populus davidiana TaxID=266767 RepID=A0A6M2EAX7_9ROSI
MNSQSKQRPEISRAETCCSLGYWCIQLFWPRVVVRKWLNISSKDSDYSADSEDDYASSDSASDTSEFVQRESRFGSNRGEDVQDAIPRIRRRKSETFRAQYINIKEIRSYTLPLYLDNLRVNSSYTDAEDCCFVFW